MVVRNRRIGGAGAKFATKPIAGQMPFGFVHPGVSGGGFIPSFDMRGFSGAFDTGGGGHFHNPLFEAVTPDIGGGGSGNLALKVTADTSQASRALGGMSRDYERLLWTMGGEGRRMGVAFGGAMSGHAAVAAASIAVSFGALAVDSAGYFLEIERAWADVTTLMPDLSKEATDEIFEQLQDLAEKTGFRMGDIARSAYQAASAGVAPEDLDTFLEVTARSARAGVATHTDATTLTIAILNAYNMEIEKAAEVSDILFTTIRYGLTTYPELASALAKITPLAASLNVQFEDLMAAFATMTKTGLSTSETITYLRRMLIELSRANTEVAEEFEKTAGVSFVDFMEQGGNLVEVIDVLSKAADRLDIEVQDLFGRMQGGMAATILKSRDFASEYQTFMGDITGATDEAFAKHEETLNLKADRLATWWDNFRLGLGGFFTEVAFAVIGGFGILTDGLADTEDEVNETLRRMREALDAFKNELPWGAPPSPGTRTLLEGERPLYWIDPETAARRAVADVDKLTRRSLWEEFEKSGQLAGFKRSIPDFNLLLSRAPNMEAWNVPGVGVELDALILSQQLEAHGALQAILDEKQADYDVLQRGWYGAAFGASATAYKEAQDALGRWEATTADRRYTQAGTYDLTVEEIEASKELGKALNKLKDSVDRNTNAREEERLITTREDLRGIGPVGLTGSTARWWTMQQYAKYGRPLERSILDLR